MSMRILKTPAGDVGIVENEMRTRQEIEAKLRGLENDPRMGYPFATVFENAGLALIQTALESQIVMLKWVLKMGETK